VLATIGFDDQISLVANEIDDVWTDRSLPQEFQFEEAVCTEVIPQAQLCIGLLPAQLFGETQAFGSGLYGPSPLPLSRERERGI